MLPFWYPCPVPQQRLPTFKTTEATVRLLEPCPVPQQRLPTFNTTEATLPFGKPCPVLSLAWYLVHIVLASAAYYI